MSEHEQQHSHPHETGDQLDITKIAIASIIGIVLLAGSLYAAYQYSRSKSSGVVLPAGSTYLGVSPTPQANPGQAVQQPFKSAQGAPSPTPVKFTAASDVTWKTQAGKLYPFTFSYPETLPLVVFIQDPMDSVAFSWNNIPPQQNILMNMEFIENRDPALVNQRKLDYVTNWWKFFSGLKGVAEVQPFTNASGLRGYKAYYINYADQTPNVDVFFEIPNKRNMMLHLANGQLDADLFDRIVDTVKWAAPSPTAVPEE